MNSRPPSFVLIPGAGGMAAYWHQVSALLEQAHHEAIAVDLPGDDANASLNDYASIVVQAIGTRKDVILVAQSLGGFTAPLVCAQATLRRLVFVNAMIPLPAETAGSWWDNTGAVEARVAAAGDGGYSSDFDPHTYFLHDVPEAVLRTGPGRPREQAEAVFQNRCQFQRWPQIPIHVVTSTGDRFFPPAFQRRVARARLHQDVQSVPGGHLVALSRPAELVAQLLRFEREA